MITLLSLQTEITREQCFKHVEFPFFTDKDYSKLIINYIYLPKDYDGKDAYDRAVQAFKEAYGESEIDLEEVKGELPLKNHVTLSLSCGNNWIGTAHRHANNMVVEVGEHTATEGFHKTPIIKGEYSVTLSIHALLSKKVSVSLEVVAYE